MISHGRQPSSPTLSRDIGGLFHDGLSLAGLQWELLLADLDEARVKLLAALVLLVMTACLMLVALTSLMFTLAYLLVEVGGLAHWEAFLCATVAAVFLASGIGAWGYYRARSALQVFRRSQSEFQENLRWLRQVASQISANRNESFANTR